MQRLADFHNLHRNETLVVCGCGESLNELARPERFVTIGVNDVGRLLTPDYLVVVNPRDQFTGDRFAFVENSRAKYLFTQLDLGVPHPHVVKFALGAFGGTDFSRADMLHYTNNSPYIALCLAILMGARRVGLIGVDFTEHHFFARTGRHPLAPQLDAIDAQYARLGEAARARGVEIFNLSRASRLTAFPKISPDDLAATGASAASSERLDIVSYATTPVAGVPAVLARAVSARTGHAARCVWATNDYGNGVRFAGDVEWLARPREAEELLAASDLVIVHNGKIAPEHERLFRDKPVVTLAHNYLWNVDQRFFQRGFPSLVVGQYQATLAEFAGWSAVPNPIPFWEDDYRAEAKPDEITICYTPSGRHERYPPEHRLYWHGKGYATTMRVLEKLAAEGLVRLEAIGARQLAHAESLAMKRRSHIVIDECVTGSYHRNSLEGLACGAVVVNGLGILPPVADVLRRLAGTDAIPFVPATLDGLEAVLRGLIDAGRDDLQRRGAENRRWLERHWDFGRQWTQFWRPAVERALEMTGRRGGLTSAPPAERNENREVQIMTQDRKGTSVVVPHGGRNRLPQLRACLANLRQCEGVAEIIVVELDDAPHAETIARRWADRYVFLRPGEAFERARALNVGSALAAFPYVLWLDNDLLVAPDFVALAVAELEARGLDFLKPYSEVRYLSLGDSEKVMRGALGHLGCAPANVYYSTTTDGGAGLVRRDFLARHGAFPGGFRGWGGEDNGWMHKVALLGRAGRTNASRPVYHLYHALSGGYGGSAHYEANPHYQANLAQLARLRATRTDEELRRDFPPAPVRLWDEERRVRFVAEEAARAAADEIAAELEEIFGVRIETSSLAEFDRHFRETDEAADHLVFFGGPATIERLAAEPRAGRRARSLLVAEADALAAIECEALRDFFGVVAVGEDASADFARGVARRWHIRREENEAAGSLARALAGPLSRLVNEREPAPARKSAVAAGESLPVWLYWEGESPAWIEACRRTIFAQCPQARLLTPETFDALWTADRDIPIAHLHVAQRADFIRAYLLKHFGGVWLDADCVAVRPLSVLLDKFNGHDFAAHRERGGYFGNDLMIAKPGSRLAAAFYERICRTLRTRRTFGWCDLGCVPLTDVINQTDAAFCELECDLVQPLCWREVEPYFAAGNDDAHRRALHPEAFCYMLSNLTLQKYLAAHPGKDLLAENTFFSFLVRTSLGETAEPSNGDGAQFEAIHPNGRADRRREIEFYLEAMERIAPRKVLDFEVGRGGWAVLLRELLEPAETNGGRRLFIEGRAAKLNGRRKALAAFYDRLGEGGLDEAGERAELIIFGDYFARQADRQAAALLARAIDAGDYVLLNLPAGGETGDPTPALGDYLEAHPEQIAAQNVRAASGRASFLLSKNDPRGLRAAGGTRAVFERAAEVCRAANFESISGPGSSLAQTAEIRRRLPLLCAAFDIESMLDAPCGDFHWLGRVDLRLAKYFGADIVASIIERNERLYGTAARRFRVLDLTRDFLPRCDLVLSRDFLVHLPLGLVGEVLRRFAASGARYLLATTFPETRVNAEIAVGDWRPLNLTLSPFNLPAPILTIVEGCTENGGRYADKSLGLWNMADVEKSVR